MTSRARQRKKNRKIEMNDTLSHDKSEAWQLSLPPPFDPGGEIVEAPRILTIGHSNHEPGHFLDLLRQYGVTVLLDVRSAPYSRYAPHFNRDILGEALASVTIDYQWVGDALGGRPDDPACYRDGVVRKGNVDYARLAARPWYQEGVRLLLETAARATTAIMCSEEDPRRCHRHHLIEATLRESGVDVLHIRRDGSLEAIETDEDEAAPPIEPSPQLALMGWDG